MTEREIILSGLEALAKAALPVSPDDWGSERQIEAEDFFYGVVNDHFPGLPDEVTEFKATVEENIELTLAAVRKELQ